MRGERKQALNIKARTDGSSTAISAMLRRAKTEGPNVLTTLAQIVESLYSELREMTNRIVAEGYQKPRKFLTFLSRI